MKCPLQAVKWFLLCPPSKIILFAPLVLFYNQFYKRKSTVIVQVCVTVQWLCTQHCRLRNTVALHVWAFICVVEISVMMSIVNLCCANSLWYYMYLYHFLYHYAICVYKHLASNSIQTIVGSNLNVLGGLSNLRSFGTSLSSGVDVDNNGYNGMVLVYV